MILEYWRRKGGVGFKIIAGRITLWGILVASHPAVVTFSTGTYLR